MAGRKKATNPAASELDWPEIERVLKLMERHGLDEFEYTDGAFHVRLKRASGNRTAASSEVAPAAGAEQAAAPAVASAVAAPETATAEASEKLHIVKSPIVGTFYSGSSPSAPPFVRVSDRVQSGQVLCIIEAMKLMNEIESDATGEIARVFVENGQPVEYGEPLFAIRQNGPGRAA